ncbi:MAG: hypothetical protein ABJN62_02650 [Halioglobus sp.]
MNLESIVNSNRYTLDDIDFQSQCTKQLDEQGALVLDEFLTEQALASVLQESIKQQPLAYFTQQQHNVYISDDDPDFSEDHPRNLRVDSSKGCITDDQIGSESPLRYLYNASLFKNFLCAVLGEAKIYPYADDLSSINVHYASEGQELGWHFDNSTFATTLLIQKPESGGDFQYIGAMQFKENGERDYDSVGDLLRGSPKEEPTTLAIEPGSLVLFRGHNAIHRVTPVAGDITRVLVVFAYNTQPGIALSESARKIFYGR